MPWSILFPTLLKGYNRKNEARRCAMKIDIQKAYDTTNWDFLRYSLLLVGFYKVMVNWIVTCISSAYFSICINGEVCGFLKEEGVLGKEILYLHLVMEIFNMIMVKKIVVAPFFKYHYGCKELKLTHMCFANDLMIMCNGDSESLKVVKSALEEFSKASGLFPNLNKGIIFFGSISEDRIRELIEVLTLKYGKLPMKYLGDSVNCFSPLCNAIVSGFYLHVAQCCYSRACQDFQEKDSLVWIGGNNKEEEYSISTAWKSLRDKWPTINWSQVVWFSQCVPKHAFILWLAIQEKLLTQDKMMAWQHGLDLKCLLCKLCSNSHNHLFFDCSYSAKVWKVPRNKGRFIADYVNIKNTVNKLAAGKFKNNIWQIVTRLCSQQ
nr:RNA-directed DNA polymerase, eukaryota, reverse transcriptase zinc-binding domain protein [Tanacetum cinerariifolium]